MGQPQACRWNRMPADNWPTARAGKEEDTKFDQAEMEEQRSAQKEQAL